MKKRMVALLLVTALVYGGVLGAKWYGQKKMQQILDAMPMPVATISTVEVTTQPWLTQARAIGSLTAVQGAELTTEVSGIVENIVHDSGRQVERGDIILTLNNATDKAELASLEAARKLVGLELNRILKLWKKKTISKSELDRTETELARAKAEVDAQRARVEQHILRAPFAGKLGIRKVNVGQFVAAGDPIIRLESLDLLHFDFTLPEQRFTQIEVGQNITVTVDALANKKFTAAITAIEPAININTRNFNVQASLSNPNKQLRPGMFSRAVITIGSPLDRIVIPRSAVSYSPYGNSVFVINKNNIAKKQFVQTAEERGDYLVIVKGIKPGDTIASSGLLKLRNNAEVAINNGVQPVDAVSGNTAEKGSVQ